MANSDLIPTAYDAQNASYTRKAPAHDLFQDMVRIAYAHYAHAPYHTLWAFDIFPRARLFLIGYLFIAAVGCMFVPEHTEFVALVVITSGLLAAGANGFLKSTRISRLHPDATAAIITALHCVAWDPSTPCNLSFQLTPDRRSASFTLEGTTCEGFSLSLRYPNPAEPNGVLLVLGLKGFEPRSTLKPSPHDQNHLLQTPLASYMPNPDAANTRVRIAPHNVTVKIAHGTRWIIPHLAALEDALEPTPKLLHPHTFPQNKSNTDRLRKTHLHHLAHLDPIAFFDIPSRWTLRIQSLVLSISMLAFTATLVLLRLNPLQAVFALVFTALVYGVSLLLRRPYLRVQEEHHTPPEIPTDAFSTTFPTIAATAIPTSLRFPALSFSRNIVHALIGLIAVFWLFALTFFVAHVTILPNLNLPIGWVFVGLAVCATVPLYQPSTLLRSAYASIHRLGLDPHLWTDPEHTTQTPVPTTGHLWILHNTPKPSLHWTTPQPAPLPPRVHTVALRPGAVVFQRTQPQHTTHSATLTIRSTHNPKDILHIELPKSVWDRETIPHDLPRLELSTPATPLEDLPDMLSILAYTAQAQDLDIHLDGLQINPHTHRSSTAL